MSYVPDGDLTVEVRKTTLAPAYERVHYVGHAVWSPGLKPEDLLPQATEIERRIEQETGYSAFIRQILVKHYPPFTTDVDFVIDTPSESPIAVTTTIVVIAIITGVITFIAFLWWTTWVEKSKLYYCDQCPEAGPWSGWLLYMAHLKEVHPDKYKTVEEAGSKNWWEQAVGLGKAALVVLGILAISQVVKSVKK